MPPDSPDPARAGEDSASSLPVRQTPPWHLVLYGLSALSILGLTAVIALDAKVNDFYARSVGETRLWANRQEGYARLGRLASDLIEIDFAGRPQTDVIEENERLGLAADRFREEIDRAGEEADQHAKGSVRTTLLDELDRIREATDEVLAETEAMLSCTVVGDAVQAREHAENLRVARSEVRSSIEQLGDRSRAIQGTNLIEQEGAVRALMRVEEGVVVIVAAILMCVCLYGRRMWRQTLAAGRDLDRTEAVIRDSERRMRLILDTAHDAFVAMDDRGRIAEWNARAEAIFGWKRIEALGRDLADTIVAPEARVLFRKGLEQYQSEGSARALGGCLEIVALHRTGVLFPVEMAASTVRTDEHLVFSIFLRDITERKRAEFALKKSEERFELAVRGSSDGLWDWNVPWDELYLSPRCQELLHDDLSTVKTLDAWLARAYAADREEVEKALQAHFRARAPFDVECRLRTGLGEHRWFRVRGQAVWNDRNEAVRMAGSITDITQHKETIDSLMRLQGIAEAKAKIEAQALQLAAKTSELEQARTAAESANRSKSEFLANMSHEIRTPMTAILGYSDLLANPSLSTDDRRDGVQRIRQNGRHLLAILNDILDLSKIEAGKMTVERIDCQVHEIVTEIASLMRPRAVEKGLELSVEFATKVPESIKTDPTRLRQILMNLTGNSIKFTERGSIRLVVGMSMPIILARARLAFEVIDTGIGMSADQVASLFRPFTQVDPSMARRFGGTGLGLTISQRLAEMLGGSIYVQSQSGHGTTFRVEIETGSLEGIEMIQPVQGAEMLAREDSAPGQARASAGGTDLLQGLRILLADDARDNRKIVSWHLRRAGAQVDLAENGNQAVQMAMEAHAAGKSHDAVLMDMQMPELDGFSATRSLRDQGFKRPVIALTAHAMSGDREQCLAAGCDDYATKPIDPPELVLMIARWVSTRPPVEEVAAALPKRKKKGESASASKGEGENADASAKGGHETS